MSNVFGGPYWPGRRSTPPPAPPEALPPWQQAVAEGAARGLVELATEVRDRATRALRMVELAAGIFAVCALLITGVSLWLVTP